MASGVRQCGWRICILTLLLAAVAPAAIATFDDLTLPPESYWNGADGSGGFTSGEVLFANHYTADWDFWDGFAYSNRTDSNRGGLARPSTTPSPAAAKEAQPIMGSPSSAGSSPRRSPFPRPRLSGLYVTNTSYAYYACSGTAPSRKKFGPAGNDADWFKLTITGKDAAGKVTGTVDFYLADFRFADNTGLPPRFLGLRQPASLGQVKTLEFALSSSDIVRGMA